MATIVLVHGAWTGGWIWHRVAPDLRARGHTVFTPTLTGLGERDHLLAPDIDLALHACDISNLLEYEDLQRVILVGHGYGGAVVQQVVASEPARIGRMVFLDALLAAAASSLLATFEAPTASALEARQYEEDEISLYAPDRGVLLDGLAARDADWVEERLSPMPTAPYRQPLTGTGFFASESPLLVVRCQDGDPAAQSSLTIARRHGFVHHEIAGRHLLMIARPEPTAELLDNFARQPADRFARRQPERD